MRGAEVRMQSPTTVILFRFGSLVDIIHAHGFHGYVKISECGTFNAMSTYEERQHICHRWP